jgi:hypothetical protein
MQVSFNNNNNNNNSNNSYNNDFYWALKSGIFLETLLCESIQFSQSL